MASMDRFFCVGQMSIEKRETGAFERGGESLFGAIELLRFDGDVFAGRKRVGVDGVQLVECAIDMGHERILGATGHAVERHGVLEIFRKGVIARQPLTNGSNPMVLACIFFTKIDFAIDALGREVGLWKDVDAATRKVEIPKSMIPREPIAVVGVRRGARIERGLECPLKYRRSC